MMDDKNFESEDEQLRRLFHQSASRSEIDIEKQVMERISVNKEVFEYKPVISKRSWFLIMSGFFLLVFSIIVVDNNASWGFILQEKFDFIFSETWSFPTGYFEWFDVSLLEVPFVIKIVVSAFVVFGLYFMISFRSGSIHRFFSNGRISLFF